MSHARIEQLAHVRFPQGTSHVSIEECEGLDNAVWLHCEIPRASLASFLKHAGYVTPLFSSHRFVRNGGAPALAAAWWQPDQVEPFASGHVRANGYASHILVDTGPSARCSVFMFVVQSRPSS